MTKRYLLATLVLLFMVGGLHSYADTITVIEAHSALAQPNIPFIKNFTFQRTDFALPLKWSVAAVGEKPVGNFEMTDYYGGRFSFIPDLKDTGKAFSFAITVTDNKEQTTSTEFLVRVGDEMPAVVAIEQTHNSFQGMFETVSVSLSQGKLAVNSFSITICYDGAALRYDTLNLSAALANLGWTFKLSDIRSTRIGDLGLPAASLSILANRPIETDANLPVGELFNVKFLITNDRTYECQFLPIFFAWIGCEDNLFYSSNADTIFSCFKLVDYDWQVNDNKFPASNCYNNRGASLAGPCRVNCRSQKGVNEERSIIFKNGGIDIVCAGLDFETFGDINLNDIAYEIADFDLMARWLAYGDSVLDVNSTYREAQVTASDANQDGEIVSVADLVYLARVIVGDARPFPKLRPYQQAALIEKRDDTLFVEAYDSIGGVLMLFKAGDETGFESLTGIEMMVGRRGSLTTVLLKPAIADLQGHIPPGRTALVRVKGKCEIQDVEVSTYDGSCMNVRK